MKAVYLHDDGTTTHLSSTPADGFDLVIVKDDYAMSQLVKKLGYDNHGQFYSWLSCQPELFDLTWTVHSTRADGPAPVVVRSVRQLRWTGGVLGYVLTLDHDRKVTVDLDPQRGKDWDKALEEVSLDVVPRCALEDALFGPRARDNCRIADGGMDTSVAIGII
jgi:hypothetical protein